MRYLLTCVVCLVAWPAFAQPPTVVHVASSPDVRETDPGVFVRQVNVTLQRTGDAQPALASFFISAAVDHTDGAAVAAAVLLTPAPDMKIFAAQAQAERINGTGPRTPPHWWRKDAPKESDLDPHVRALVRLLVSKGVFTRAEALAFIKADLNAAAR